MKLKETELSNGVTIIGIEERDANLSVADEFKVQILEKIAAGKHKFVFSFKKVTYVDSSFLGALVSILKSLLPVGGKVVLIDVNSNIQSLFEITRLDKVFVIENSLEHAQAHF